MNGQSEGGERRIPVAGVGIAATLLLSFSIGCGGIDAAISRELHELERMAFVPAGRCVLNGYEAPFNEFSIDLAMLIDRYEVTVGDWRHYFGSEALGDAVDEPDSWPMALDWAAADRLGELRGMRLLRAAEWIYCATGPRGRAFPWGPSPQSALANTLELRLGRPAAVGTFENGAGPFDCHDLLGNVWEWVADRVPGRGESLEDGVGLVSVMGGSWRYRMIPLYSLPESGTSRAPVFNAISIAPETRSRDIGVRHGAEASDYLWRQAARWGTDAEAQRRLIAVGRRFGADALELLEELAARPDAASGLGWLAEGAAL